jgi:hypothetical protein
MNRKFHIAINTTDLDASISDYSLRLGSKPCIIVQNDYALWRTEFLNFSIRCSDDSGNLRHLGWEDETSLEFSTDIDCNGITWEKFTALQQQKEIESIWSGEAVRYED